MNPKDWKFPMACPACGSVKGSPYSVMTDDTTLKVDLRCGDCRHEWAIAGPSPSIFLKQKDDRRTKRAV